ncbi:hypothetical protein [Stygiolobus caldivivus]|uniref:Uncharacterized protein n=1 Tax=Stygiolobus caldivivus TaxID=2824673 RepID=A0A8D5U6Z0_9CREN|nr:hypothetical protein [Stygiolobus caldivivus]BCU70362.1 hypothetical protein KN1_16590 [Stygiolobus caldivivus]
MVKIKPGRSALVYFSIFLWDLLVSSLIFKGHVIYSGDQDFIIYPHMSLNYLEWGTVYPYTNYPYGFQPSLSPGSWVVWLTVPFELFGAYGEQVFTLTLMLAGSIFTYKLNRIYFSNLASLLGAFIYSSTWYIFSSSSISSSIFLNDEFVYFTLPLLTYLVVYYTRCRTQFSKFFLLFSLISFISLSASGDIFPFIWLYLVILLTYFLRNIWKVSLTVASVTLGQLYWLKIAVAPTIETFSKITNVSYYTYLGIQSYVPFTLTVRTLGAVGYTAYPLYILLLSLIVPILLGLTIIKVRNKNKNDIMFFFLIWLIGVGFLSSETTPFKPLVEYGVSHFGLFAPLRDSPLFLSPVLSLPFTYLVSSFFDNLLTVRKGIIVVLLTFIIIGLVLPYPVLMAYNQGRITIPQQFIETVEYLNNQKGQFTVLLLPFPVCGWYGTSWYYGNNIFIYFLSHPLLAGGTYSSGEFKNLTVKLNCLIYFLDRQKNVTSAVEELEDLLLLFNVKYIVIECDAETRGFITMDYIPPYNYTESLNVLQHLGLVKLVENYSPFLIYKVKMDTSYVYETNASSSVINLNENLSKILVPVNFKIKGNEVLVCGVNSKHLLLTFAYSPYWTVKGKVGNNSFGFIEFNTIKEKNIIIVNSLSKQLTLSYVYAVAYLIVVVLLYLLKDFLARIVSLIGIARNEVFTRIFFLIKKFKKVKT